MRRGTAFAALGLLTLACGPRLLGDVEFERGVDFARFQSVAFAGGSGGSAENRALAERELRSGLEAKGLRFTSPEKADLQLRLDMGRRSKVALSGAASRGVQAGMVVELLDRRSGSTVWRGFAAETYYGDLDAAAEIPKAVELILGSYPPPGS